MVQVGTGLNFPLLVAQAREEYESSLTVVQRANETKRLMQAALDYPERKKSLLLAIADRATLPSITDTAERVAQHTVISTIIRQIPGYTDLIGEAYSAALVDAFLGINQAYEALNALASIRNLPPFEITHNPLTWEHGNLTCPDPEADFSGMRVYTVVDRQTQEAICVELMMSDQGQMWYFLTQTDVNILTGNVGLYKYGFLSLETLISHLAYYVATQNIDKYLVPVPFLNDIVSGWTVIG